MIIKNIDINFIMCEDIDFFLNYFGEYPVYHFETHCARVLPL